MLWLNGGVCRRRVVMMWVRGGDRRGVRTGVGCVMTVNDEGPHRRYKRQSKNYE